MGDQREGPEGYYGFQEERATVIHWCTRCKRYKLSRNGEERVRIEQLIVEDCFSAVSHTQQFRIAQRVLCP